MNRIYSKIWNKALGQLVVASELAHAGVGAGSSGAGTADARMLGGSILRRGLGVVIALALAGSLFFSGIDTARATTYPPNGAGHNNCSTLAGIFDGRNWADEVDPIDGSGTYSNVLGCSADGGGYAGPYTGVSLFGSFSVATGDAAAAFGLGTKAGRHGTAIGSYAIASGNESSALGATALASGNNSVAIGVGGDGGTNATKYTQALGDNSIAIGGSATKGAYASGPSAIAIGDQSVSSNLSAIAIGNQAAATGSRSLALGYSAAASGGNTLALGSAANATNDGAIALGASAEASSPRAVAIGMNTVAAGGTANGVVAIGAGAEVSNSAGGNNDGVAIGNGATAISTSTPGSSPVAIGVSANAQGTGAQVAVGANTQATGTDAVAIGGQSSVAAAGTSGIAVGRGATVEGAFGIAEGDGVTTGVTGRNVAIGSSGTTANAASASGGAVAIGRGQAATGDGAVAIGDPNTVNGTGAVALGANNVAAGNAAGTTPATGAVAIGNSNSALGNGSVALGNASHVYTAEGVAIGNGANAGTAGGSTIRNYALGSSATATGGDAIALGDFSKATGAFASALGETATASGVSSTALGVNTKAAGAQSLAAGATAIANNTSDIAFGSGAVAGISGSTTVDSDIAIGGAARATGGTAVALGRGANASQASALAMGNGAISNVQGGVAIGNNASTSGVANSVALGAGSTAGAAHIGTTATQETLFGTTYTFAGPASATNGTVSVGTAGSKRQIQNVAAGDITASSTDAVNGSQLNATNQAVIAAKTHYYSVNSTATGAGTNYDNDGATGANALAAGLSATAPYTNTVAVGVSAAALGNQSVAIGNGANTRSDNSVAIGTDAQVTGKGTNPENLGLHRGVAIGAQSIVSETNGVANEGVAVGLQSKAVNTGTVNASPTAIGAHANATGNGSQVAIGDNVVASGMNAVAIGGFPGVTGSSATGDNAVAVGPGTSAGGDYSVSMGQRSNAGGVDAIAIGGNASGGANASQQDTIAIGAQTVANVQGGIAIGQGAHASNAMSTALGVDAITSAPTNVTGVTINGINFGKVGATGTAFAGSAPVGVVSLGTSGSERQITNVAAGRISNTSTDAINGSQLYAVAQQIGNTSSVHDYSSNSINTTTDTNYANGGATGNNALAAGVSASAVGDNSVAAGVGSNANGLGTVAIGQNAKAWNDAGGNNTGSTNAGSVAIGDAAQAVGSNNVAVGSRAAATGSNGSSAFGVQANATGISATAIGLLSSAVGDNSVAVGSTAQANGLGDIALGRSSVAGVAGSSTIKNNVAIGNNAQATGGSSIAIGTGSVVSGANSGAFGDPNGVTGANSYAFGNDNTISADNAFVLGNDVTITTGLDGAVALGNASAVAASVPTASATVNSITYSGFAGATPAAGDVVSVGSSTAPRQIQNVAAGRISATSTDAINGSQLYMTNQAVGNTAQSLASGMGGTSKVNSDGTVTTTLSVGGTTYTNVNDALTALDTSANAGWNVTDGTNSNNIGPDGKVTFTGDSNIAVAESGADDDGAIGITLNPDLDVTSVTTTDTAGNTTVMNGSGVTVTPAAAGSHPVSLTTSGLDNGSNKIVNVADGTADSDAATVGQTKSAAAAATTEVKAGTNVASVAKTTDATDGHPIYTVNADDAAVSNTDGNLTVSKATDSTTHVSDYTIGLADSITVGPATGGNPVTIDGNAGTITGLTNTTPVDPTASGYDPSQAASQAQVAAAETHYYSVNSTSTAAGSNYNNDGATGNDALAAGVGAKASEDDAVALGHAATASGQGAVALGDSASATGDGAYAQGSGAKAVYDGDVAIGSGADTTTPNASSMTSAPANNTAIGLNAKAQGGGSLAMGYGSLATGTSTTGTNNAVALGPLSKALDFNTTAVGVSAVVNQGATDSVAVGSNAVVGSDSSVSVAVGSDASVGPHAPDATAIGASAQANAGGASALGSAAEASGDFGTALGDDAHATNTWATAVGVGSHATGSKSIALGRTAASGADAISIGTSTRDMTKPVGQQFTVGGAFGDRSIAIGKDVRAKGNYSIAMGNDGTTGADAEGANSIALGGASVAGSATAAEAVAIGHGAQATGGNSIAIGTGNVVSGANSGAFGDPNTITGTGSYAFGNDNTIGADNAFVLGSNVTNNVTGSVVLGNNSTVAAAVGTASTTINGTTYNFAGTTPVSTVSVGADGKERTITNVAAGRISATSTDAINGSELYATNQAIGSLNDFAVQYDKNTDGTPNDSSVTLNPTTLGSATKNTDGIITTTGGTALHNVASAGDITQPANALNAVNAGDLNNAVQGVTSSGLTFTGNDTTAGTVHRNLGQTLAINGQATTTGTYSGANVKTVTDPTNGAIQVQIADNPAFTSVTAGNSTLDNSGLTVDDGAGNSTAITTAGTTVTDAAGNTSGYGAAGSSVTDGTTTTTTGANGVTITGGSHPVSLTDGGLDNGSNQITNVASGGTTTTNAANIGDVQKAAAAATSEVAAGTNVASVTTTTATDGHTTYTVNADGASVSAGSSGDVAVTKGAPDSNNVTDYAVDLSSAAQTKLDNAVQYDGSAHTSVTLGGTSATTATKLTNVAAGDVSSTSSDAVNGSQLYAVKQSANAGWNVTDGTNTNNIGPNGKVTFSGDSNVKVAESGTDNDAKLAVTLNPDLNVTSVTTGGTVVDNSGVHFVDGSGNPLANSPVIAPTGIDAGSNQITHVASGGTTDSNAANIGDVQKAAAAATSEVAAGTNVASVTTTTATDGHTTYTVNADGASVSAGSSGDVAVTKGAPDSNNVTDYAVDLSSAAQTKLDNAVQYDGSAHTSVTLNPITLGSATKNTDGTITTTGGTALHNVASAGDITQPANALNAVNASDLNNAVVGVTTKGLSFAGDSGTTVHRDLGDTLNVVGGETDASKLTSGNIGVVANGTDTLNIQLAKNLTGLGSVQITDGAHTTTINPGNVTLTGGPNNDVVLGNDGLNNGGNQITNVADGKVSSTSTDAVNGSQLAAVKGTADSALQSFTTAADGTTAQTIDQTDNQANFKSGKNIQLTADASGITVATTDDLNVTSVTAGNSTLDTSGLTVDDGKGNKTVVSTAGTTVTDAAGDSASYGATGSTITDATGTTTTISPTQVVVGGGKGASPVTINGTTGTITGLTNTTPVNTSAPGYDPGQAASQGQLAAVQATANEGWNVSAQGGTAVQVKPGDTVDLSSAGSNLSVSKTDNGTDHDLSIALAKTLDLGSGGSITTGGTVVDNGGVHFVDGSGNPLANSPVITPTGIDAGSNQITHVASGGTTTTNAANIGDVQKAAAAATSVVVAGTNVASVKTTTATDGHTTYTVNADGASVSAGTSGDVTVTKGAPDSNNVTDYAVDLSSAAQTKLDNAVQYDGSAHTSVTLGGAGATTATKLTNVAAGDVSSTSSDAVNGSQLYAVQQTASAGWNVGVNGGTTTQVKPGDNVDFSNTDGNLEIAKTDHGADHDITVNLANDIDVTSVTAGNSKLDTSGLTVDDGSGNVTTTGATGTTVTDASGNTTTVASTGTTVTDGTNTTTYGSDGLAIAGGPTISSGGIDAAGTKITHVAAGVVSATSTDAVNGSQLNATNTVVKNLGNSAVTVLGGNASYDSSTGTLTMSNIGGTGKDNINDAIASANSAATAGWNLTAQGANSSNVGPNDAVDLNNSDGNIVISKTATSNDVTFNLAKDIAVDSVSLGNDVKLDTTGLLIVGGPSITVAGIDAGNLKITHVAPGTSPTDAVNKSQLDSVSSQVQQLADNTVQYDDSSKSSVTLGGPTSTDGGKTGGTKITNVHRGDVSANSTDAVNGSQLYETNQHVADNSTAIQNIQKGQGGYFQVEDSSGKGHPSASGKDSTAGGAGAVASGDRSVAVGSGAKATGKGSVALGEGSVASRDDAVSVGSAGHERQVTHVAPGTEPTDAANVGQLNGAVREAKSWAKNYTDRRLELVNRDVNALGHRVDAGVASAMAMASMPQAYAPNQSAAAVGLGQFHGEVGVAVGLSTITDSGRYVFKFNASGNTRGDVGVGVGAAVVW